MKQKPPSKIAVKKARLEAGLTQTQAAHLVGYALRTWQQWEAGDRVMRRSTFEYFLSNLKLRGA